MPWEALVSLCTLAFCVYVYFICLPYQGYARTIENVDRAPFLVFTGFYLFDLFLRLLAYGFGRFLQCSRLPIVVVVSSVAMVIFLVEPGFHSSQHRLFLVLSVSRIITLLSVVKDYSDAPTLIFRRSWRMVTRVLICYIGVLYMFATVAYYFYGYIFLIDESNPIFKNTSWYQSKAYSVLSFSTFNGAFRTIFFCCLGGQWESIMLAAITISASSTAHLLFWLGFRLVVGLIMHPILTGFFVQIHRSAWKKVKKEQNLAKAQEALYVPDFVSDGDSYTAVTDVQAAENARKELRRARQIIEQQRAIISRLSQNRFSLNIGT